MKKAPSKTLLLTSDGINTRGIDKEILKILSKPASRIRLAHIITASKPRIKMTYIKRDNQKFKKLGFKVENIDIEGKNKAQLEKLLKDRDIIYVRGGNSFYLLKATKKSGFDKVVRELVKKGVVYIGVSAGSYLACPTIEMANWKRQDKNIVNLKDLTALNLVPFLITTHYKPIHRSILKREVPKSRYPVKIITDNQAILVQNGQVKLVGKGKEVKI
jgi:dipeptidase E